MPRYHIKPECLTAEERLERIVKLLAVASVRLAEEETKINMPEHSVIGEDSLCGINAKPA